MCESEQALSQGFEFVGFARHHGQEAGDNLVEAALSRQKTNCLPTETGPRWACPAWRDDRERTSEARCLLWDVRKGTDALSKLTSR